MAPHPGATILTHSAASSITTLNDWMAVMALYKIDCRVIPMEDGMCKYIAALLSLCLGLFATSTAFAQSGEMMCEQDLLRIERLYNEKQAALTPAERQDAMVLMDKAKNKCRAEGAGALNVRSQEANMLLEKLQNAPSPSQAAVPSK